MHSSLAASSIALEMLELGFSKLDGCCVLVLFFFPPSLYASDRQYAFLFGKRRRRGSECRGREAWEASRGSTSAVSRLAGRRSTMERVHCPFMLTKWLVVY